MRKNKWNRIWLLISICSFLLMSASFLMMPLGDPSKPELIAIWSRIAGAIFWSFFLLGMISQAVLWKRTKREIAAHSVSAGGRSNKRIGVISFGRNTLGLLADILCTASLLGCVITMIATDGRSYICYIFIFLFVFLFCMHSILNGRIFMYICGLDKQVRSE